MSASRALRRRDVRSVAGDVVGDRSIDEDGAIGGVADVHVAITSKLSPQTLNGKLLLGQAGDLLGGLTEKGAIRVVSADREAESGLGRD